MIECTGLNGSDALSFIDDLAELRCKVFREYPYLYEGDLGYEREYLTHYTESEKAFLVIAKFENRIVGVSTCLPLVEADPAFQQPFREAGYDLAKIGYFGESVLLPEFRGHGVGHRFFDLREDWAQKHHFTITTFCSVIRPDDHAARPTNYRSHDEFWKKRGYQRHDELIAKLDWPEVTYIETPSISGISEETPHSLVFWIKSI
ncbi:MAG: GNAT family N-acetyltransferase [Verrucomicrobiota bacterium]